MVIWTQLYPTLFMKLEIWANMLSLELFGFITSFYNYIILQHQRSLQLSFI